RRHCGAFAMRHGLWLESAVSEAMDGLDIDTISLHVRNELRRRLESPGSIPVPSPPSDKSDGAAAELAALRASADVYDVAISSGRWFLAPLVSAAKRAVRRLLTPSLGRQVTYNLSNVRVIEGLREYYGSLARHHAG